MKQQIQNYLNQIYSEIQKHYSDEINLRETDFEKYSIFDFVNFHLIYHYILDDSSNKNDFFICISENEYRKNFFSSIFHSIVLIKLYQNYFNYENTAPELNKGDLIYRKYNREHRIFIVKDTFSEQIKINFKFPKKNEIGINDFLLKKHFYTKLNPNLVDTKKSAKNVDSYREFLSSNFNEDFPFITDFKNRTLVIAEKQFFNESKFLPIRYTNKNGKISNDLPFFSYLVECCNDFDSAKNFLLNNNECFDEIIIIGAPKYRNNFDFILQEKYRGKYKTIILIGSEKPNTENQFLEWFWSNDEVKIANNEEPNSLVKIKISDEKLHSLIVELKSEVDKIKDESGVNLSFMLKYTNFFMRMLLVNTNLSKGIFQEYLDRLNYFFQSEAFSEEINKLFYGKDVYNPDTIKNYTQRIFDKFSEISKSLEDENLKWNYIKEKAKSYQGKVIYLVVEKKNYDAINNQLLNERINNIHLISDKRIDNSKLYLDKWLNDNQNSENKLVIIPYLNNKDLFLKAKQIKGACQVLSYENLDEISFDNVERDYQNQEKTRLTHKDRKKFVQTDFTTVEESKKRELDDIFSFDLNNEDFKTDPNEIIDLPKERVIYEVVFDDSSKDKFDSTKGVFVVENGEQIKTTIGELYDNATIRFYQNNSPNEFRRILKIFDTENLLDSFDEYSESWKETLRKLSLDFGGIEKLYNLIFDTYKINYITFKFYFAENTPTRFPIMKTLEAIREFCVNNGYKNELIVNEFEKFKIYSKKDHSIRQQAGKILGNDLLDYIASDKTDISDSLSKLPEDILKKLTATIQQKTVTKKTIVNE
ncbi:hypothetical protein [Pedobacter sp.]|uniref:hypothetical protein n=1 Tax=Pedobacter sp. TaxID=1411316 RepID=UPI00396CAC1A